MPKKRMLINPATHGPPSFKEPEMEEDSDEIVLGELDPFASPSLPDLMNSPSDSLDSAGTDDDERDSVCFVEIEERPERSRPAINKATARRTPFSRSASSNTIVLQPSDKEENDTVALEDEDQEEEDDEIILATPSPPGSPLHPIVPLPRPGSSIPKKRRVVASDSEEERDEAVVQHREGLRKKTKQSGTVQVQRPISDHHLPYSDVASSSRTKPSRPTQQRPPSPTTSSTSSAGCYVLIGEESADAISDGEEEQKSKDGNQSRELRNRRVTMLAEDSTTSASRRKQKGKQKEKGGKKNRRGSVGIDVEEDKLALPPQALPVRSPSVAVLTGRSCGPDFKILNIPGQPTLEELKTQQSEQQVVADQLSERLFNADVPWTKSDVVFKDPVRGGRAYNSISIGDQTFSRHDHVHLIIPVKDKEGPNAGPGGMGWFARIEEFYRVLSEKDFPGKMRIRWYYHSKSETASGSFGHDQELYKSDSFDDVHISSLRTKVSVKYFSDGPVDGFDFFCRASLSVGRLETDSKSFTLLNHYSESHQVSTPLKILDVCSGFGGMAQGFVDAGVGEVEWAIESDPIPAATNAINSPNTRVLNLDINDVVAAVASALKEEVEGDDGPPPLISLKDRGLADQLDGRLNDAYTGYYKLSDLPTKSGEVGLAIITLPCQGWSGANSFVSTSCRLVFSSADRYIYFFLTARRTTTILPRD
ncbi:hypothetical protein BDY24DRAFT_265026 [Mrakia frigida]|uniref:uncharacterized protein n=1 Tax=Mrakia frigida TaxID=29902 RepID=UPI003FCBFA1A